MTDEPSRAQRLLRGAAGLRQAPSRREVADLAARVSELEEELQEARRLNVRVADLLDIVEELLVPIAQRDEAKVREYLHTHSADL